MTTPDHSPERQDANTGTPRLPRLTPSEARVLALCAEGLQTLEIAARLGISRRTVDFHRRGVMLKHARPGRRNSVWAVLAERGMVGPEPSP